MSTSLRAEVIKLLYFEVNKNKLLVLDYKSLLRVYQIALSSITKGNEDCRQPEQIWDVFTSSGAKVRAEPRQEEGRYFYTLLNFIHLKEGEAFLSHWIRVLCYNLDQRPVNWTSWTRVHWTPVKNTLSALLQPKILNNCVQRIIPFSPLKPSKMKHDVTLSLSTLIIWWRVRDCPQNILWALHSPHFSDEVNCQPSLGWAEHKVWTLDTFMSLDVNTETLFISFYHRNHSSSSFSGEK